MPVVGAVSGPRIPEVLDMGHGNKQAADHRRGAFEHIRAKRVRAERRHHQREHAQRTEKRHDMTPVPTIACAERDHGGGYDHNQDQLMKGAVFDHGEAEDRKQRDDDRQRQTMHETQPRQNHCGLVEFAGNIVRRALAHGHALSGNGRR